MKSKVPHNRTPDWKVELIFDKRARGHSIDRIASELEIGRATVWNYLNGSSWVSTNPTPNVNAGPIKDLCPRDFATKMMTAIKDLGSVQLIEWKGNMLAAIPNGRASQLAEKSNSILATYDENATTEMIEEDVRHIKASSVLASWPAVR